MVYTVTPVVPVILMGGKFYPIISGKPKFREEKEVPINMLTDTSEIENTLVPDTKGNQICGNTSIYVSERHDRMDADVAACKQCISVATLA